MRTIVFTNQKGGTGKTTLAVLYALWLADRKSCKACFIDLDSQCNASKTLRAHNSGLKAELLFRSQSFLKAAEPPPNITVFAGSKGLIDLERAQPGVVIPAFREQVDRLGQLFDVCVIDTPPSLGLRMSAALMAGSHVVCPIELEEYSIDGVTDMLRTVFGVRQKYNPALRLVGIVANRFNGHSVRQRLALTELIANYDEFIVPAKISTRSAIPEGLAAGVPVWRLAKSSARDASEEVSKVFELLGARMTEMPGEARSV